MSFASVHEYINSLDENAQKYICEFVSFMKSEFPEIVPKISFAMPMWWADSKMFDGYVAVSAAKSHYSIHFHNEGCLTKLKGQLPNCTFGKRCINVKYGDEHAISLVKQLTIQYMNNIF